MTNVRYFLWDIRSISSPCDKRCGFCWNVAVFDSSLSLDLVITSSILCGSLETGLGSLDAACPSFSKVNLSVLWRDSWGWSWGCFRGESSLTSLASRRRSTLRSWPRGSKAAKHWRTHNSMTLTHSALSFQWFCKFRKRSLVSSHPLFLFKKRPLYYICVFSIYVRTNVVPSRAYLAIIFNFS